jgi:hypothetical protein
MVSNPKTTKLICWTHPWGVGFQRADRLGERAVVVDEEGLLSQERRGEQDRTDDAGPGRQHGRPG